MIRACGLAIGVGIAAGGCALGTALVGLADLSLWSVLAPSIGSTTLAAVLLMAYGGAAERSAAQLSQPVPGGDASAPGAAWPALQRWIVAELYSAVLNRLRIQESLESSLRAADVRLRVAELEARHSRELLDALREAVVATDRFGDLVFINSAAARLFGLDPEKSIHQRVDKVITDPSIARLFRETQPARSEAGRKVFEQSFKVMDRPVDFEVAFSGVALSESKDERGLMGVFRDVTREREISKAKTDFVAKASHELRTPLANIRARIEMLADGDVQDEGMRAEFYAVIQSETLRLGQLVDQMLNISRIEAGITQAKWEEVDLAALAQQAVDVVRSQAQDKRITIESRAGSLSYTAMADREMMLQVLINLVSNAVKYTPEGGHVTATTEVSNDNEAVTVFVDDTGLGIPPEALPKMFQKFYRVEQHQNFAKGTGLGLNLVKQVVEVMHNGEVGVTSAVGKGSRFWVTIPCRRKK